MTDDNTESPPDYKERREGDRRQSQQPFEGPDRRKGDRQTGEDRRRNPRT